MYVNSALPAKLLREDVDLKYGYAVTRATAKKARKNSGVPLHPIVVPSLRTIAGFNVEVFPGQHTERAFWRSFRAIQAKAGVQKTCSTDHLPWRIRYPECRCLIRIPAANHDEAFRLCYHSELHQYGGQA